MPRYYQKIRKLDNELKVAGMEALVPEELARYLLLNATRRSTHEAAEFEVVTYAEAKTGLRIRDTPPSTAVGPNAPRETRPVDPMDVSTHLEGQRPTGGCLLCGGAHYARDCPNGTKGGGAKGKKGPKGVPDHWQTQGRGKGMPGLKDKSKDKKGKRDKDTVNTNMSSLSETTENAESSTCFSEICQMCGKRVNCDIVWNLARRCSIWVSLATVRNRLGSPS